MTTFKPVAVLALAVLGGALQAHAQSQTQRPGSYGWVADKDHALKEQLARDVAYQAGRLRPEEQVKKSGFWSLLDTGLRRAGFEGSADAVRDARAIASEMTGSAGQGTSRNVDALAIMGDAEERKRLRAKGLDILDAVDDRKGGLQAMVLMDRDTADRIRSLRNAGTPEGQAQARALLATQKSYLAFRGTEPDADLMADVQTDLDSGGRVGGSQYYAQRAEMNRICGSYGNVHVTGHSLGGAQAQRFAANCPASVKEVVTFAAPAIGRAEAERFASAQQRPKVTHYVAKHDVVSSAGGQNHLPGTVREVTFEGVKPARMLDADSMLAAHSRPMLAGGEGISVQERDYAEYQSERVSHHYELQRVIEGEIAKGVNMVGEKLVEKAAEKAGQVVGGKVGGMVAGELAKSQAGWMAPMAEKCDVLSKAYKASACNGFIAGVHSFARRQFVERLPVGPGDASEVLTRAAPPVNPELRWAGVPLLGADTPVPANQIVATAPAVPSAAAQAPVTSPLPASTPGAVRFVDPGAAASTSGPASGPVFGSAPAEDEAAFRARLQQQRDDAFAQRDAQVSQQAGQQRAQELQKLEEGRAQMRAGLAALAGGLAAVQQQQQAYNAQMEVQRQAQNARMAQVLRQGMAAPPNVGSLLSQGGAPPRHAGAPVAAAPRAGQPGYPVLDPFAARYAQQAPVTPRAAQAPAAAVAATGSPYPSLDPFAARQSQQQVAQLASAGPTASPALPAPASPFTSAQATTPSCASVPTVAVMAISWLASGSVSDERSWGGDCCATFHVQSCRGLEQSVETVCGQQLWGDDRALRFVRAARQRSPAGRQLGFAIYNQSPSFTTEAQRQARGIAVQGSCPM